MFDCDKCGACCKSIRYSYFYSEELDRGDGVCKHLTADNLCAIYAERPIFCNIDAYHEKFLSDKMSRADFHELNHAACERLKNPVKATDALERYDELLTLIELIAPKDFAYYSIAPSLFNSDGVGFNNAAFLTSKVAGEINADVIELLPHVASNELNDVNLTDERNHALQVIGAMRTVAWWIIMKGLFFGGDGN